MAKKKAIKPISQLSRQMSALTIQKPTLSPKRLSLSWNPQRANFSYLIQNTSILRIASNITKTQSRSVTKFSLRSGKRKTLKAPLKRFYRLDWGGWIRTRSGRNKKLWKKSHNLKRRLRQHVLVNSTQSWMLDKMVTKYWRRPKYYVDDPYRPYHTREEYFATQKKPKPF